MSTFAVTAEKIDAVLPIDGADRIELAQIGGYRSVVPKGLYKTGDVVVYVPEQALVPQELLKELGLYEKLAGPEKNRVKAMKLRGELSQGIICCPLQLMSKDLETGKDYAEELGITKWVPQVPAHMNGKVVPAPEQTKWIDIENLKRYIDVFAEGEMVSVTEKLHGTCLCVTATKDNKLIVASKGYNAKGLALEPDADNLYWRIVNSSMLEDRIWAFWSWYSLTQKIEVMDIDSISVYGEIYGKGVQDLHYGEDNPYMNIFDVHVVVNGYGRWLERSEWANADFYDIPAVPVVYEGPYSLQKIKELTDAPSCYGVGIREGVVIRALPERYSDKLGGRCILKSVSAKYLTRKNGTEYE